MNRVISDHTAHIYLAQDPPVTTSSGAFWIAQTSGAFCGDYTTYSTSVLSKKAPEEVVTDGSWARYMCAVWSEMTPFITHLPNEIPTVM